MEPWITESGPKAFGAKKYTIKCKITTKSFGEKTLCVLVVKGSSFQLITTTIMPKGHNGSGEVELKI